MGFIVDNEVVILCGGRGARLGNLTCETPKPLLKIGGEPILQHIMRIYAYYGFERFILLLGYKAESIIRYFRRHKMGWDIRFELTGLKSDTAERLWRVRNILEDTFALTYADVLTDADLKREMEFHKKHGKVGTMLIVPLPCPYGVVKIKRHRIRGYIEKPRMESIWINGGFMIFDTNIFDFWEEGTRSISEEILPKIAKKGELQGYKHRGFWAGMDTFKEYVMLNDMWKEGNAKWAVWRK